MNLRKVKYLSAMIMISSALASPASHALELGVLGGVNVANPSMTVNTVASTKYGSAAGISFGGYAAFGMMPMLLDAEVGLMLLSQKYTYLDTAINTQTIDFKSFHLPVIARLKSIPVISPGLGLYMNYNFGDVTTTNTSGTYSASAMSLSGISAMDFGVVASLRASFNIAPMIDFVADARYLLALKDVADSVQQELKLPAMQAFAGVSFGF